MEAAVSDSILPRDPRTLDWPLVGSKQFLVTLLLGYVYLVKIGGPRFMKGRKPFDSLKPLIMLYNLSMVFLNAYFVYNFLIRSYFGGGYNIICQGIDFQARDQMTMEFLELCYWYLWVRIADFLDTIFFVLRKKFNQVSTLHVVHHSLVVLDCWFWHRIGTDGHVSFIISLNTFVHIVMYTYYFLSSIGPHVQKYLWWKRYLTQLQITQFIVAMFHGVIPLFYDCGYPKLYVYLAIPQGVLFLYLFFEFYFKVYIHKSGKGFQTVCKAPEALAHPESKTTKVQ